MRTLTFIIGLLFISTGILAQNPFQPIGKKGKVLTLSNGKYDEVTSYDSLQRVGSVIVNMRTRKVVEFLSDTIYSESSLEPTIVSRHWSIDPLANKFPEMSPYNSFANNPIIFVDKDGREVQITGVINGVETTIIYVPGQEIPAGASQFMADVITGLNYIHKNGMVDGVNKVQDLVNSKAYVSIVETQKFMATRYSDVGSDGGIIKFNSREGQNYPNGAQSPVVSLAHEIDHAWMVSNLQNAYLTTKSKEDLNNLLNWQSQPPWSDARKQEELRATLGLETVIANSLKQGIRTEYILPTSVFQTTDVMGTTPNKAVLPATQQFIDETNDLLKNLPPLPSKK